VQLMKGLKWVWDLRRQQYDKSPIHLCLDGAGVDAAGPCQQLVQLVVPTPHSIAVFDLYHESVVECDLYFDMSPGPNVQDLSFLTRVSTTDYFDNATFLDNHCCFVVFTFLYVHVRFCCFWLRGSFLECQVIKSTLF
jgi:hypothetical protein